MQVRCLLDTHVVDIKPPLTIIYVGNGCEAYSNNLYIPAKSELTSRDDTVVRHNYFQQFNEKYQNLTKYSLIEDLGIEKLTNKEIENLPDRLAALATLRFNELKKEVSGDQETSPHTLQHSSHITISRGDNVNPLFGIYSVENIQGSFQVKRL